jgi:hypothetical protein
MNAHDVVDSEWPGAVGEDETVETILEPNAFHAGADSGADDGADDGVQTRRVSPAGQDANTRGGHGGRLACAGPIPCQSAHGSSVETRVRVRLGVRSDPVFSCRVLHADIVGG